MSTQTAINDLSARIQSAFTALEEKGVDLPAQKTTYTLKTALEDMQTTPDEIYTKVKFRNGTEAFFELTGTLSEDMVPGLSDAVEFQAGIEITDIAAGLFSDCSQLTSVTIWNKTWQDAIDNSYWGISDPNIMHGDWDRYLSFANASRTTAATVKMQKNEIAGYPLAEVNLLSSNVGTEGSWQPYNLTSIITLNSYGDRVFLKATTQNTSFANGDASNNIKSYWCFLLENYIAANGSVMSLLDGENVVSSIDTSYCFTNLFKNCNTLVKAPELPAKLLSNNCYRGMFANCTNLITAPDLPAESLAENCYQIMFYGCTSLKKSPKLPAKTLNTYCYSSMFYGCTSLTEVQEIQAIQLADDCCYSMFRGCTNLINGPILYAQALTIRCYKYMFQECYKLTKLQVAFINWYRPNDATTDWLKNAGTDVPETTFICPNQLDVSTRSNNTIPEDTGTHTWNIVKV